MGNWTEYFKEKRFLVTGASSGIGRAIALKLIDFGANVCIMARSRDKLEEIKQEAPNRVLVFPGDVSSEKSCKGSIEAMKMEFKGVDGIIHSAGVSMRALAEDSVVEVFKKLIEINYYSMVYLFKYSLEELKKTKGHLVGISSVVGKYSTQYRSGYAASKHALEGFLKSLRLELYDYGIHVMIVSPGFVRTNVSINAFGADGKPHGKMDEQTEKGLDPDKVAIDVLKGVYKRKREVIPAGGKEKLALFLSRCCPSVLEKLLLKANVT